MKSLTEKQAELWEFIVEYLDDYSQFPSYAEMQEEFGYSSTNSIFQHLNALEKKNYLTKKGRGNYDIHPSKRNQLSGFYPAFLLRDVLLREACIRR